MYNNKPKVSTRRERWKVLTPKPVKRTRKAFWVMATTIAGSGILGILGFFGGLLSTSSVVVVDSAGFFAATGGGIGAAVAGVVRRS
jgi:hypothetical protein